MGAYTTAYYTAFVTKSVITANSANASYPASNVNSSTRPNRIYKSSNDMSTSEWLVFDMASATSLDAVVIDNINSNSVKIQGNATDSWGSPSYDSGAITVSEDKKDGRYKLYHTLVSTSFDVTGYRYMRILCNQTLGGSKWEVGSVVPVTLVTEWTYNMGFPYEVISMQASDPGTRVGGGGNPSTIGNRYCRVILNTSAMPTSMEDTIDDFLGISGQGNPVLFYPHDGSATETAKVYLCHRIGDVRVARAGPGHLQIAGIVLEEYV